MSRKAYETWIGAGYEGLINAIIKQAVQDYATGLRAAVTRPHDYQTQKKAADARRFFLSKWFDAMTDIDGKWIVRKIEQDVAEEIKKKKC